MFPFNWFKNLSTCHKISRIKQKLCLVEYLEDRCVPADLTLPEVQNLATSAIHRWADAGASASQIQILNHINYQVADLGSNNLGQYRPGMITLDDNAAGNLWFIDGTPGQDEEFTTDPDTGTLTANSGTLAYGKIDLLTVLMHEQGHVLGLVDIADTSGDVMSETLQPGERRLPVFGQSENAIPGSLTTVEYLTTGSAGSNSPVNTLQPYVTMNYVVALQGIFPSRNLSSGSGYLGSVDIFAGNFAPIGYALAQGQLMSINQNPALFAILGTNYGGDGVNTFALPDLQGRVPIGAGQGPGLSNYALGQKSGVENVTLGINNLPAHTHTIPNSTTTTSVTGGGQPFENRQPTLALTPIVNVVGLFPTSNLSTEDLLGSVSWFAGNYAPNGTHIADGSLLSIAQNAALFSILGTTYGGNGISTFALPDLRGRMAIGVGTGPGLQPINLGQVGGTESTTLDLNTLPAHAHTIPGTSSSTGVTGGSQPIDNLQPYLGINFDICAFGVFPQRPLGANTTTGDTGNSNPVGQGLISGDVVLDESAAKPLIDFLVQEGINLWHAAGIDDAEIAKLEAVQVNIGDLPSGGLAQAGDNVITIDRDASNRGWFIDPTPGDNVEFGSVDPTGELVATDPNATNHFDLLTTIMHEQGHILGLNHTQLPGDLMYGGLNVGVRKLPIASDVAQIGSAPSTEDQALEGTNPIIASVGMFAGNFPPRNWSATNRQLLPIFSNTALFSLIGTTYGGDGQNNFALPDTQGRAIVGVGQGSGLSAYTIGQSSGADRVTLSVSQIPAHDHVLPPIRVSQTSLNLGTTTAGIASSPTQSFIVSGSGLTDNLVVTAPTGVELSLDNGSTWQTTETLIPSTGTLAGTTIQVRITASATPGGISGNITNTSTGSTEQDVSVSGTVIGPPTVTQNTSNLLDTTTSIVINGTNFDPNQAHDTVSFTNGAQGIIASASSTSLTVNFTTQPTLGVLSAKVTVNGVSTAFVQVATVTPVVASVSNNILTIQGDNRDNTVALDLKSGDSTQTEVLIDYSNNTFSLLQAFPNATFNSVIVQLGNGADSFTINNANGNPVPSGGLTDTGGTGGNTLIGPASTNTWNITGIDTGTLNSKVNFNNIANLIGNTGADTFQFQPAGKISGSIDGGGSGAVNTLDYNNYGARTVFSLSDFAATGIHSLARGYMVNIQSAIGSSSAPNNLFVGPASAANWKISLNNAGNLNALGTSYNFSQFQNLTGGSGNDAFQFAPSGSLDSALDGGLGSNTLDYSLFGADVVVSVAANAATAVHSSFGGSVFDFQNFIGNNTNSKGNNLLAGPSTGTTWNITGANTGNFDPVQITDSFTNFQNLAGGAGNDTFNLTNGGSLSGYLDGGAGSNTVNYATFGSRVVVDLSNAAASGFNSLSGGGVFDIQTYLGSSATNNLFVGPTTDTFWNITANNAGSLTSSSGLTYNFSNFQNLAGGTGKDTFKPADSTGLSGYVDGGLGINTLNYFSWVSSHTVNLANHTASNFLGGVFDIRFVV